MHTNACIHTHVMHTNTCMRVRNRHTHTRAHMTQTHAYVYSNRQRTHACARSMCTQHVHVHVHMHAACACACACRHVACSMHSTRLSPLASLCSFVDCDPALPWKLVAIFASSYLLGSLLRTPALANGSGTRGCRPRVCMHIHMREYTHIYRLH